MQKVSSEWKRIHEQTLIPGAYVEIEMSNTNESWEENKTYLGGDGFEIISEPGQETYIGMTQWTSDDNGSLLGEFDFPRFGVKTYDFSGAINGITITWDTENDEYATSFFVNIESSNGSSECSVRKYIIGNNLSRSFIDIDSTDIISGATSCTITIFVEAWSKPNSYGRIQSVHFGQYVKFGKSEIVSYSHINSADPICAEAPVNEISFEIIDKDGLFVLDNENGITKYFMGPRSVIVKYGIQLDDEGTIEWIPGGVFYLTDWESSFTSSIEKTFTAKDALGLMTDYFDGVKTYLEPSSSSVWLFEIVNAVIEQANLPALRKVKISSENSPIGYEYIRPPKTELSQILGSEDYRGGLTISTDIDLTKYTLLEVLQYIANSVMCVLYTDRYGTVHIEPFSRGITDYEINMDNSYTMPSSSLSKKIKEVNINDGTSVFSLLETGDTSLGVEAGEIQSVENPLATSFTIPYMSKYIGRYLREREVFSGSFRVDPRLDALDIVTVTNKFTSKKVVITRVQIDYNGGFKGSFEGRVISVFKNKILNGGFQQYISHWNTNNILDYISRYKYSLSDSDDSYLQVINQRASDHGVYPTIQQLEDNGIGILNGHKFYVRADFRCGAEREIEYWPILYLRYKKSGADKFETLKILDGSNVSGSDFTTLTYYGVLTSANLNLNNTESVDSLAFAAEWATTANSNHSYTSFDIDNIFFVDLTETFGAGLEPDAIELSMWTYNKWQLDIQYENNKLWYWRGVDDYTYHFGEWG